MKRKIFSFCLVLLVGYVLATLLNLPTLNVGLLKFRGVCRSCDLTNANLVAMDLHGVDLYFATLVGANLSGANLIRTNLSRTDLSGANLEGTEFCETQMSDGAINNSGC